MSACPVIASFVKTLNLPDDVTLENSEAPRKTQKDRAVYISDWAIRGWCADIARHVGLEDIACDLSCLGDFYELDIKKLEAVIRELEYKRTPKYYECIAAITMAEKAVKLARTPMTKLDWVDIGALCRSVLGIHSKYGLTPHTDIDTVIRTSLGQLDI
jgi:hypothetical protein